MQVCRSSSILAIAAAVVAASLPAAAAEPTFPSKPVRIMVGVPAGANVDIVTRLFAEKMAADMGQPVVVENRPGASALVATQFVAKAPADGYTLLAVHNTHAAVPVTLKNPGWEWRNFTPVGALARVPMALLVDPASPTRSVTDLVARAKERPGAVSSGTGGEGSAGDIATALLAVAVDARFLKVPYKGSVQALADLIGGRLDVVFDPVSTSAPQVKAGKARAVGVTGRSRSPLLPDVPTLAEAGVRDYYFEVFNGLVVPAGTPREIVARLHASLAKARADAWLREQLLKNGIEVPVDDTPATFAAFIEGEVARHARLVKDGQLRAE